MSRQVPVTVVVVAAMAVAFGLTVPAAQSAEPFDVVVKANPVTVRMSTSEETSETATTALLDALQSAPARTRVVVARVGSGLARERMVTALADGQLTGTEDRALISGSPFTATEQAAISGVELIGVPTHAVGAGIMFSDSGPWTTGYEIDPALGIFDEDLKPEPLDGPFPPDPSTTMLKMPWPALASAIVSPRFTWTSLPGLFDSWGYTQSADGKWRKAGSDRVLFRTDAKPSFSPSFEPSSLTLYLQQAVVTQEPALWQSWFTERKLKTSEPSERFLFGDLATIRSKGVSELVKILGTPGISLPGGGGNASGTIVAAPMWLLPLVRSVYPDIPGVRALAFSVAELQNGAKQWTAPTSDSITKAVAAGGEEPLFALTNNVPDAYPLSWVESMYLPDKGLSIDETNGLAAFARLLITDGQTIVKRDGDGVLSPALKSKALAAINDAVTSNCAAADGVPLTQKESPYYPAAAEAPVLAALGAQVVCGTKVPIATTTTSTTAATTTTTAAATTTTKVATTVAATTAPTVRASTQGTSARTAPAPRATPSATTPAPTTPVTTAAGTPTTVASSTTVAAAAAPTTSTPSNDRAAPETAVVRTVLPLGLPDASIGGFDRFLTMAMGGGLLLLGRRIFLKRRRFAT